MAKRIYYTRYTDARLLAALGNRSGGETPTLGRTPPATGSRIKRLCWAGVPWLLFFTASMLLVLVAWVHLYEYGPPSLPNCASSCVAMGQFFGGPAH